MMRGATPGQRSRRYALEMAALTEPSPVMAKRRSWRSAQVRISVAATMAHPLPTCSMMVVTFAPLPIAAQ